MHIQPLRRSSRLRQLGKHSDASNQATLRETSISNGNTQASLLGLSPELRLCIYQYLVVDDRPFLIGRFQEDRKNHTRGGPRDVFLSRYKIHRDDHLHRPVQPAISRVCRLMRKEVLPTFYQENQFWLIHNEFRDEDFEGGNQHRRFDIWLQQTPSVMFDFMRHVSLCGYTEWPNRIMITLDLKDRRVTRVKEYSIYGDQLDILDDTRHAVEETLSKSRKQDGFTVLKQVLADIDWMYDIPTEHISTEPGISRTRKPLEGPEYDW